MIPTISLDNKPIVSIVMPAYNAEKYIAESVNSVIGQSLTNWELIIVNDGSEDGTRNYLETLADHRIRIIHQHNKGVSSARNSALDVVQGEFITFLDADDVLPPGSLEVRVNFFQLNPEVDVVDGIVSVRNDNLCMEISVYRPYYYGELLPRLIRLDNRVFFNIAYMLRANKIGSLRFHEEVTHAEDLLFYMEFSCANKSIYGFVGESIYVYRKSSGSAMSNMEGLERGYLDLIRAVSLLPCPSIMDLLILRFKISKILFLCWISSKEYFRSFVSVAKILFFPIIYIPSKR